MRLATYNVEWFDALFDDDGRLRDDDGRSGRQGVRRSEQLAALGTVFRALDADAVMVIEAPDGRGRDTPQRALENFAARFGLRARRALIGFRNRTQQEIALLYDPEVLSARHDPRGRPARAGETGGAPRFDSAFGWEPDGERPPERVRFSKPPLEVDLRSRTGRQLRLIGVHLKSKAPHGARGAAAVMRRAIRNRRRQLAQALWLRARIERHLAAGDSLLVMGDLNDGPGLDEYERLIGRSSVEIVLGEGGRLGLHDPHARMALGRPAGAAPSTARFLLPGEGRHLEALLDYIMVSPDLARAGPQWRIWHPFDDPACRRRPDLQAALLLASDHFPVSIDLPDPV